MLDKTPERIKEGRRKVGLSQSELGKIVHVTKQSVSKWEKGENIPEAQTMNKLADLFGYTIDYLYGRCDKQNDDIKNDDFHNISLNNDEYVDRSTAEEIVENALKDLKQKWEKEGIKFNPTKAMKIFTDALEKTEEE
jgi:DNA-binding XRE family transcriptional regulator